MKIFGSRWQKKNKRSDIENFWSEVYINSPSWDWGPDRPSVNVARCCMLVASCVCCNVEMCRRVVGVKSLSVSLRCQEWYQVSLLTHQGQTGDSLNKWWNILDTPSFSCIPTQRYNVGFHCLADKELRFFGSSCFGNLIKIANTFRHLLQGKYDIYMYLFI